MLISEDAPADVEHVALQRLGVLVPELVDEIRGEQLPRHQRVRVLGAEEAIANFARSELPRDFSATFSVVGTIATR